MTSRGKEVKDDERELWEKIVKVGDLLMSDEEDGDDSLIVRSPSFRSQAVNDLILELDNRAVEKQPVLKIKRVGGPYTRRTAPPQCPPELLK